MIIIKQQHSFNNSGGRDTITTQYSFSGQVLRILVALQKVNANPQSYRMLTKMNYDAGGRLLTVSKKFGNSAETIIASNSYDELGRLSKKNTGLSRISLADLSYSANPLDSIGYLYTIRGWLTGINKDYTSNQNGAVNWFDEELNYDYGFSAGQVNGTEAGTIEKPRRS